MDVWSPVVRKLARPWSLASCVPDSRWRLDRLVARGRQREVLIELMMVFMMGIVCVWVCGYGVVVLELETC